MWLCEGFHQGRKGWHFYRAFWPYSRVSDKKTQALSQEASCLGCIIASCIVCNSEILHCFLFFFVKGDVDLVYGR